MDFIKNKPPHIAKFIHMKKNITSLPPPPPPPRKILDTPLLNALYKDVAALLETLSETYATYDANNYL